MSTTTNTPEPVLTAATVAGVVTTLATVLGWLGFTTWQTEINGYAQTIGAVIIGAVTIGSHLLAALHARGKVTPIAGASLITALPAIGAADVSDEPDPDPELEVPAAGPAGRIRPHP